MRRAHWLALTAVPWVCLLAGWLLHPASARVPSLPEARGTIEPTLPLIIDLRLEAVQRRGPGGSARLEMVLEAGSPIGGLTLALRLPEGLAGQDFPPALLGAPLSLAEGERQKFVVPLAAARAGTFPLRVEATYALPDGRAFRTEQGATLTLGVPVRPGRSNAGAYEFMGVPLEELGR